MGFEARSILFELKGNRPTDSLGLLVSLHMDIVPWPFTICDIFFTGMRMKPVDEVLFFRGIRPPPDRI